LTDEENGQEGVVNYQDLGGPTPFNYRPDDDSVKLSTTLTPKVRKWRK